MDYLNYTYKKNVQCNYTGLDELYRNLRNYPGLQRLKDFISYPYPISYNYNDRGFRDHNWPDDLSDVIWCVGDSFTAGVGVPSKHRWTNILQNKLNKRCINLGIDGASNELIRNICLQILREYNPKTLIPMWSFFHRRHEDPWNLIYNRNNLNPTVDFKNFLNCFGEVNVNSFYCNTVHLLIPPQPIELSHYINIFQTTTIDVGRDGYHFDYKTAEIYVDHILSKLT